jgi:hypothetical protein
MDARYSHPVLSLFGRSLPFFAEPTADPGGAHGF